MDSKEEIQENPNNMQSESSVKKDLIISLFLSLGFFIFIGLIAGFLVMQLNSFRNNVKVRNNVKEGDYDSQLLLLCTDSDEGVSKPIYVQGLVIYRDSRGDIKTRYDECTGSKKQVLEMQCIENPLGSGNYNLAAVVYNCPNGCENGACISDY